MKTKVITIKMSEEDLETLEKKAAKSNMNRSEYLRRIGVNGKTKIQAIDKKYQKKVLFLLSNLTNNINQVAFYCNTYKKVEIDVLNRLDAISNNFKAVVEKELMK